MVKENKKIYFTTSWDDGSVWDLKLLSLLNKYGIKGTFYIPNEFNFRGEKFSKYDRRLSDEEIRMISNFQEIGAHSLTHSLLTEIPEENVENEVAGSKRFLEAISGEEIKMFCPPGGKINDFIVGKLRNSGFKGARLTGKLEFSLPDDPFNMNVSVQCSPMPFRKKDCRKSDLKNLIDPLKSYGVKLFFHPKFLIGARSWKSFAESALDRALRSGNYFHLYGHSWELEKYCLWDDLEDFLKKASKINDVEFLTNSQVIEKLNS